MNTVTHPIPPVFDSASRILILGSFPSVKSREGHFFYHHPQNRFWKTWPEFSRFRFQAVLMRKRNFSSPTILPSGM